MYLREERMKAIELYIKHDKSIATVIHELGYPSHSKVDLTIIAMLWVISLFIQRG